jgi:hypothetical protein
MAIVITAQHMAVSILDLKSFTVTARDTIQGIIEIIVIIAIGHTATDHTEKELVQDQNAALITPDLLIAQTDGLLLRRATTNQTALLSIQEQSVS